MQLRRDTGNFINFFPVLFAGCVWASLGLAFLLFAGSAVEPWHVGYGWHEQQRIYQLLLLVVGAFFVVMRSGGVGTLALHILLAILLLGALSSVVAQFPAWAFKEWARYGGLTLLALVVGARVRHSVTQYSIVGVLALVAALLAYQFFVLYCMAFVTGIQDIDPWMLMSGFANPRFLNQFQVLLMPFLAAIGLLLKHHGYGKSAFGVMLVLLMHWCMVWALGGRGVCVAMLVVHGVLWALHRPAWKMACLQFAVAILGLGLYAVMFFLVPFMLGVDQDLPELLRGGLSAREVLWGQAWQLALANPWLGAGPMHFAALHSAIAAHPHQVVLQWASEWGMPATLLALGLGGWGMWSGIRFFKRCEPGPMDLAIWLSIGGALILAQVDGVFVMPYTETWLAIIIGLAIARWGPLRNIGHVQRWASGMLALAVVCILGWVLVSEVPTLPETQESYRASHSIGWSPRFWLQGYIPM